MKYIAYFRVSRKKQEISGLGLEAQKAVVAGFLSETDQLIDQYTETESGNDNERPQLDAAINAAKAHSAKLLIAKLDRLSRNVRFIFSLKESEVDFLAIDIPEMNTLTVGMMAVIAQHERETIAARTKAALEVKKRQGFKLGTPENLTDEARQKSLEVRTKNAFSNKANRQAAELIIMYREKGMPYCTIADRLNANGYRTRRQKLFRGSSVYHLYIRFKDLEANQV
jgi:DNA invertase Pin-like site-specific DNA recombinase